jgi:outer membrane receptor protein involved in Fe transport
LATAGRLRIFLLLLLVVGLPLTAMAQTGTGRITGVVTDSTGGVLPGVTVSVKGPDNAVRSTVSDSNGKYLIEKLAPGSYTLSFELAGFAAQSSTVVVAAGQAAAVETKLQIGARTEAVQVTGTLIPRPTLEAMSPVTTLEVEELTYRGINRVEDLLTSLPQVFVAQNSSVSNGASGTATVDLRYLGPQRTLVLIDGRRMASGDAFSTSPDLNFIPSALVKRVDVLTGGASSTYGADAVAGVVNFVLDRDFTGFKGGVEYSGYQHNNNNALAQSINAAKGFSVVKGNRWNDGPIDFNVAFGSKFADGKGHASFYLDYRKTNAITKDQRDYTNCSVLGVGSSVTCGGSGTWPTGRFIVSAAPDTTGVGGDYVIDPTSGLMRARTGADVYNYAPRNFMQRPDQRWAGGAFMNYDLNKYMQVYGDVMFMDDTTDAQIAESGDFGNTLTIDCRNPLIPAQAYGLLCSGAGYNNTDNYTAQVQIYKRNVEGGGRVSRLNHTDLRYTGGVKGTLNNVWSYDVYGMQATVRSPQSYSNDLNYTRIQNTLDIGPDGQCVNDAGNGCVPWNIFSLGHVTPAALAYLNLDEVLDSGTRTRVFNGTLKADLKDYGIVSPMATESVKVAFGGEYRQEFLFVRSDYAFEQALGAGSGGPTLSVDGVYSVKEFFVEGLIPVVQDKPMVKDFSVEAGLRESNYSSTGTHATYKIQASYAPTPDFKFRVGYNRATRSPNITELYTPQGLGLGGSADPCAGGPGLAQTPSFTAAQCALTGVPTTVYGTVLPNPANQYNTLGGGNPNLSPEVANTWTGGAVITPRKFLPGFTATIDYYDVKINSTIGSLGSNDILNTCATTGALCNLIHRDQFYTTWRTNSGYVLTANANVGKLQSRGIDITGSYTHPVPGDLGAFSINLIGTYLLKSVTDTGLYSYDCVGFFGNTCGVPTPTWRHLTRFSWETPWKITVTAGWRFIGPTTEDSGSPNPNLANPVRFAQLQHLGYMADHIPSFSWLDLGVTWKITKGITFIAGVNNVLDKEPPLGIGNSPNDYGAGFYNTYDSLGRYIHTGFQFTF